MSGFEMNTSMQNTDLQAVTPVAGGRALSQAEIDAYIASARKARGEHVGALLRQLLLSVSSLWRRPGRLTTPPANKAASA